MLLCDGAWDVLGGWTHSDTPVHTVFLWVWLMGLVPNNLPLLTKFSFALEMLRHERPDLTNLPPPSLSPFPIKQANSGCWEEDCVKGDHQVSVH
jgi:hypothetical protein